MAFNNVLPSWLVLDLCRTCLRPVKSRDEHPGTDCEECGGTCKLKEEDKQ